MDQEDKRPQNIVLPAALVAGLVALGLLIQVTPYDRARPSVSDRWPEGVSAKQDVEARLWEDPFAPIQRHRKELLDLAKESELKAFAREKSTQVEFEKNLHSFDSIRTLISRIEPRELVVYIAMVPASPYAESAELRRRLRYAILSGFARLDLVPAHKNHIGYAEAATSNGRVLTVPYEELEFNPYFEATDPIPDPLKHAVVLWVDADTLSQQPIQSVDDLLETILPDCRRKNRNGCATQYRVKVLGPLDSDALMTFASEACNSWQQRKPPKVEFYSPTATLSEIDIEKGLPPRCHDVPALLESVNLVRVTQTTEYLLGRVVDELKLRGVDPEVSASHSARGPSPSWWSDYGSYFVSSFKGRNNRIAIVSEWDTLYGKVTPETLKRVLKEKVSTGSHGKLLLPEDELYTFSYMRGLDGAEAESTLATSKSDAKERDQTKKSKDRIERAEGNAQLDYLRRLADKIKGTDDHFLSKGEEGFGAIGILGTDFYDKLLILQALKSAMPNKLFFTLELDSRFTHPDEQKWARNLIVASSFGLTIQGNLQRYTPPFRDSRQTAAFLSTMVSLNPSPLPVKRGWVKKWLANNTDEKGGIFEIGRTAAFEFGPSLEESKSCKPWALENCDTVDARRPAYFSEQSRSAMPFAAVASVLAVGLAIIFFPPGRDGVRWRRRRIAFYVIGTLAVIAVGLWTIFWSAMATKDSQPFLWYEGISIWPTLILRIATIGLTAWFLWELAIRIRKTERDIESQFRLNEKDAISQTDLSKAVGLHKRLLARIREGITSVFVNLASFDKYGTKTVLSGGDLWIRYRELGRPGLRWTRVALGGLAFFILGLLVFTIWPAHVPYRGSFLRGLHVGTIMLCVILMNVLVFRVMDAIWLVNQFLERLCECHDVTWPRSTTRLYARELSSVGPHTNLWILLRFVADLTKALNPIIYYPFIVLTLMLVSRSSAFAPWTIEPSLIFAFSWSGGLAFACWFYQRRAAERIRSKVIERLTELLIKAKGAQKEAKEKQIVLMLQEAKALKKGAFAPISEQPAVRALLLSIGGVGGTYLLEFLTASQT